MTLRPKDFKSRHWNNLAQVGKNRRRKTQGGYGFSCAGLFSPALVCTESEALEGHLRHLGGTGRNRREAEPGESVPRSGNRSRPWPKGAKNAKGAKFSKALRLASLVPYQLPERARGEVKRRLGAGGGSLWPDGSGHWWKRGRRRSESLLALRSARL